jgi:hypothetical protein
MREYILIFRSDFFGKMARIILTGKQNNMGANKNGSLSD